MNRSEGFAYWVGVRGSARGRSFPGLLGLALLMVGLLVSGCGGGGGGSVTVPVTTYTLTVNSSGPVSGIPMIVVPADTSGAANGTTNFTRTYDSGTAVEVTAPATAGGKVLKDWTGCAGNSLPTTCDVNIHGNTAVTANYTEPRLNTVTVHSTNPASGVGITVSPADWNGAGNGNTSFTRVYLTGQSVVTLTAPTTAGGNTFTNWTGCSMTAGTVCTVGLGADFTVTANYTTVVNAVTGVTVTPNPAAITVGAMKLFAANVTGTGTFTTGVTWAVNGVAGGSEATGTIDATGLYVTPYPAPASVTVTATSTFDATKFGSAVVNLTTAAAAGPALTVDAAADTHPINPLIYGMNAFGNGDFEGMANTVKLPVDRWGGDATTRYNYKIDSYDSAGDYYFEAYPSSNAYPDVSVFNKEVERDLRTKSKTLGTIPLIGWTTKAPPAGGLECGFSVKKYGAQLKTDPYHPDCGNGIKPDGKNITGNDPTDTSFVIDETFGAGWVKYLVNKYGDAAHGGIAIYDLDNEPEYWFGVHVDVHPDPLTYDELTTKGLTYAKAIKDADPTAEVSGPVISSWDGYYYSPKDWVTGWSTGPNYVYNGNPIDRMAHGNIPLIEYYLQQFKGYDDTNHERLLDYLDVHGYYAAGGTGFASAGTTEMQAVRLNSTRALWDPTYQDAANTDPTDTTNHPAPGVPMLIRRMKAWVAADYPGTKTAIDEYNWGAQDHINGAVAQADILGIFGREGLDLGALWGAPDPATQKPSVNGFAVFRNYDGAGSGFGETSVSASSADQGKLAVYAAVRTADNTLTLVVVNKSFSDLTSTVALKNVTAAAAGKVFLYSNANLNAIVAKPDVTVVAGGIAETYPAQSITVIALPLK